jgi:hypothetical protein
VIKIICDGCGKEVVHPYKVTMVYPEGIMGETYDFCDDCKQKAREVLEGIVDGDDHK